MSIYNTAPNNNLVGGGGERKYFLLTTATKKQTNKKKTRLHLYMQMSPADQPMNSILNQPYNKQLN